MSAMIGEQEKLQVALVQACRAKVVKPRAIAKLVSDGARPDAPNIMLEAVALGRFEVVRALLDAGAQVDGLPGQFTPLQSAAQHNQPAICQLLLERGAKLDLDSPFAPGVGSALHVATTFESLECLEVLLAHHAAIDQQRLSDGSTPLISAVNLKSPQVVIRLLDAGADPHASNRRGESALEVAIRLGLTNLAGILRSAAARRAAWRALGEDRHDPVRQTPAP